MLLPIPAVLNAEQVKQVRGRLDEGAFADGAATAGAQARRVKQNQQLPAGSATARELGKLILDALRGHPVFVSGALPRRVTPPMFNRYASGMTYGAHVDNAVMFTPAPLRTDLSVTVFLSEPGEYDGGELVIEELVQRHNVKLPAGSAIVYPSTSMHRVEPVTRGARLAAVLWVQSLVRDDGQRRMLFDLDRAVQALTKRDPASAEAPVFSRTYHNLVRMWADA